MRVLTRDYRRDSRPELTRKGSLYGAGVVAQLPWPHFGRTRTLNAAIYCAPVSSISAGQRGNGQAADRRDTVYGSEGSSSLLSSLDSPNVCSYADAARREPASRCWGRGAGIVPVVLRPRTCQMRARTRSEPGSSAVPHRQYGRGTSWTAAGRPPAREDLIKEEVGSSSLPSPRPPTRAALTQHRGCQRTAPDCVSCAFALASCLIDSPGALPELLRGD